MATPEQCWLSAFLNSKTTDFQDKMGVCGGGGPANTSYPQGSKSLAKVQEAKEKEPPDPWDQQEAGGALHHSAMVLIRTLSVRAG